MRVQNVVSHARLDDSLLGLISRIVTHILILHHLTRRSMLHILGSIDIRCNVLCLRSSSHYDLLVASDIGRTLRSLATFLSDLV